MTHNQALREIVKVAKESSDFSRRMQCVLNTAMLALGYTENQRRDVFVQCLQRAEQYKEIRNSKGTGAAKKWIAEAVKEETGEDRQRVKNQIAKEYV